MNKILQVSGLPSSVESLLKSTLCGKRPFPYGDNEDLTFYNPGCIEDIFECKDLCGKKCQQKCKMPHDSSCLRGTLPHNAFYCPMQDNTKSLDYLKYELKVAKNIKEGKKAYKKMEKVYESKSVNEYIHEFISTFPNYAKHKVESWYIATVRKAGMSSGSQPNDTLFSVSDFAQNLKLSSKHETSEEYFHKTEISIFGTVSTVNVPESPTSSKQHSFSQITASDNK